MCRAWRAAALACRGLIGFGLVAHGSDCVIWYKWDDSKDFPIGGVTSVVISWVFSPVASGIVAAFFFFLTRTFILRAQNSFDRTFIFLPILVGICFFINTFYVLDKGLSKQVDLTTAESAQWAALAAAISILLSAVLVFFLKKKVAESWDRKTEAKEDIEKGVKPADDEGVLMRLPSAGCVSSALACPANRDSSRRRCSRTPC